MKFFFCVAFPLFLCFCPMRQALPQSPSAIRADVWYEGSLQLFEGGGLSGKIRYNLENDNVNIIASEGLIKSFSSIQVESFQVKEPEGGLAHDFFSLPIQVDGSFEKYKFFELLSDGFYTLLLRERIEQRSQWMRNPYSLGGGYYQNFEVLVEEFYVMDENSLTKEISPEKGEILRIMKSDAKVVEKYMEDKKIRLGKKNDLIRVFVFFNSLHPMAGK